MKSDDLPSFCILHSSFCISFRRDLHVRRLFAAEREVVAAQAELDRISKGGPTDDLHRRTVHEAHLQQPAAQVGITTNVDDLAAAANAQLAQGASANRRG